jgi:hypothetical protein
MRSLGLVIFLAVVYTTAVSATYEYNPLYTVTSGVADCQQGGTPELGLSSFGCPIECRGFAVDDVCVCVACDTTLTKDAQKSLTSTPVVQATPTVLTTPGFTMDIGSTVFPSAAGDVQVDVYDRDVVFGVLTTQKQVSDVFVFRPFAVAPLNHFVGVTINYSAELVYPGWIPYVYTMNMTSGLWYDIAGSVSYGDGTIYFETDTFLGQYVVIASSKSGALLSPRSFYGRVCECATSLEVSMPCNSVSDVQCSPPRVGTDTNKKQFTLKVTLPALDASTIDEYVYRAALAQLSQVDFRDVIVSSVVVE